jgi:hypothetical protein
MVYVTGSRPLVDAIEHDTPGVVAPAAKRVSGGATTTTSISEPFSLAVWTLMLAGEKVVVPTAGEVVTVVVALDEGPVVVPVDAAL